MRLNSCVYNGREKARKITLECRLLEEIKEKPLEAFVDFTRGKAFGFYD